MNGKAQELPLRMQHLRWPVEIFGIFLALLLACGQAGAQTTVGVIAGSVTDSSGSVVADATVALTNTDEGTARTTRTDAAGEYRFPQVKAAHYSVVVTAAGFEKWSASDVVLAVRQELRLDVHLAVGTVRQEVTVTGESVSTIETESPTVGATFTREDAANLPVNTRASFTGTSAFNILGTLPGMQADSSGFSLQGSLPYQTDVTVDGVTTRNAGGSIATVTGTINGDAFPSTESISEIRVDGDMNNAEFSDPGQVVITTKGGTNKLHGTGFWYYQNSAFDAIPYTYPTTVSKVSQTGNTFGGSLGGPVVIPHLYNGHNRSFFYGAYEGWRHPAQATLLEKVPSTLMKNGDFSNYNSAGFTGLKNPFTGGSYGSKITDALNPIAVNTLKQFYPDPNIGNPAAYTDDSVANWQQNVDDSGHSNQFDVRGDQYFGSNQKFLLWGRFTWKNFPTSSPEILSVPSAQLANQSRVLKVDTNWTITPHLINEGGFGLAMFTDGESNSFDGAAWTQAQGWKGLQNLYYNGIPQMVFYNVQSLNANRITSLSKSHTYDYSDELIWIKGRHTFKFGVNVQHLEAVTPLTMNGVDQYGNYQFNSSGSAGLFTGVDFADFLLGLPNQTFYDVVSQDNDGISGHYNFFAQDEWRINPRLTLSFGDRYTLQPGYYDRYGDIGNFDPTVPLSGRVLYPQGKQSLLAKSWLASANACDPDGVNNTNSAVVNGAPCMQVVGNETAGYPKGLKKYPHLRFMPRFGFAFRPLANDKWAIRGGVGFYNITMVGSSFYSLTGTIQTYTAQYQNALNASTHTPTYQWPQVYAGAGSTGSTTAYGTDYFGTANSVNWKDPYTEQWSLSVDHDFGSGYGARLSYIGSETHQLVWAPDENTLPFSSSRSAYNAPFTARLFPNWGRINTRATGANQSYNSLQMEADHRMQRGFEFHTVFTWAKSLADNQGPSATGFASDVGGGRATSVLDRHADFGNVYGTRKFRWNSTMLYDLPFGRGKQFGGAMSRPANAVLGGWRLSSIFTWQSGAFETPYFPSGQGDPSGTGSGLTSTATGWDPGHRNQHPDRVAAVSMRPAGRNRLNWVNGNAFTCPGYSGWKVGNACTTGSGSGPVPLPIGRFGNSPVGVVPGPGLVNLSSGLSKTFAINERVRIKTEGTFTNILNHTNLGDPNMDLSSPSFGVISNSIGSDFGGARTGQISARVEF